TATEAMSILAKRKAYRQKPFLAYWKIAIQRMSGSVPMTDYTVIKTVTNGLANFRLILQIFAVHFMHVRVLKPRPAKCYLVEPMGSLCLHPVRSHEITKNRKSFLPKIGR